MIPPRLLMARRLHLIHHACCMDDCDYEAPSLTIASNCVERKCPECHDQLKMVLPTKVAYEMGDKNTARYEETRHFLVHGYALNYCTQEQIDAALPSNAIAHHGIQAYFDYIRNQEGF